MDASKKEIQTTQTNETMMYVSPVDGEVVLHFSHMLEWFALPPDKADDIAQLIIGAARRARKQIQ